MAKYVLQSEFRNWYAPSALNFSYVPNQTVTRHGRPSRQRSLILSPAESRCLSQASTYSTLTLSFLTLRSDKRHSVSRLIF